ncbi:MAG: hypothetical protein ABSC20_01300 [Candidatus Bathyarchaeia archaeon]
MEGIALGCFFGLGFESCFWLRLFLWALAAGLQNGVLSLNFSRFLPFRRRVLCLSAFFGKLLEKLANHAEKSGFIAS